jgi:hypothetical protein
LTGSRTPQQKNAERQRADITKRVLTACRTVIREVKSGYDASSGRYRYPHNDGRLTEAEVLRRAAVDKNTIKAPYHQHSRTRIRRVVSWTKRRCEGQTATGKSDGPTALEAAQLERETYAQLYASLEALHEALEERHAEALKREHGYRDTIAKLEERVASLTALLARVSSAHFGANVIQMDNW